MVQKFSNWTLTFQKKVVLVHKSIMGLLAVWSINIILYLTIIEYRLFKNLENKNMDKASSLPLKSSQFIEKVRRVLINSPTREKGGNALIETQMKCLHPNKATPSSLI